ncbi:short chain dehydrogenase/oxidoreductase CpoX2 [Hypomontagnella monticulosa]|nr:short chain dehydrogenase/oxidoreductase CpoX2 [Hypomontagnella monticulosa]
MASVASKVFAITGGASGIGAATCQLLAQRGASVVCIGDISPEGFDSITKHIKKTNPLTQVNCAVVDITSSAEVERWIGTIIATYGNLHGAANIAGVAQGGGLRQTPAILEETDEAWARIMKVNLDGVFYCTRAEVRAMKDLPAGDRSIVNVASVAALHHVPDVFAYGTSKGACVYFTTCVAADAFPVGIRVNCVSPGITNTPLLPQFQPAAKSLEGIKESYRKEGLSLIEPEDVARSIVWLLSEDSRPVYGTNISVGACMP